MVSAVFLAAVALAAVLVWTGIGDRQPTPVSVTPPASNLSTIEWVDVSSWESSGGGDSPPFHISAETWRVQWVAAHDSVGDGSFAVHVYKPNGLFVVDLYDTADSPQISFDGPLRGTLALPGPGDFFLRTITARDYQVTVLQPRR